MKLIRLTLADDRRQVLIRADLIHQARQREHGADIWLPTATVAVAENIDEIQAKLTSLDQ